jgi:glycosyltransferase involved in cell wall biosynthesis
MQQCGEFPTASENFDSLTRACGKGPSADDVRRQAPRPRIWPRPMRILHWLDLWWRDVGGPIRSISDLAEAMRERGHDVVISTADPRDAPRGWIEGSNPRMRAFRHGPLGIIARSERARLRELVRSVDVVHLHGLWERSTHSVAGEAYASGVPFIVSTRGVLDDWAMTQRGLRKRLFLAAFGKRLLGRAASVHCTSIGEARQVESRIARRATVIPNLLRIEPLLELRRMVASTPRILFLGRLHESKGLDLLIRAVASLRDAGVVPSLDVAGAGAPQEVRAMTSLVEDLRLESQVRFLGHLDDAARQLALSEAWIMALPTAQENFGNAMFESLAAGVPVLASKGLDAEVELESSGGALLVERDPQAIAAGLAELLLDHERRDSMSASAREWCARELHPGVVGARFESLYQSALAVR